MGSPAEAQVDQELRRLSVKPSTPRPVDALLLCFGGVGMYFGAAEFRDGPYSPLASTLELLGPTLFVMGLVAFVYTAFESATVRTQEAQATQLEADAQIVETLVDYIEAQLKAAGARQEVSVVKAERRANRLAATGFYLMLSSVFVPFVLVYLYITLPPTAQGDTRDWHLLLAGVSFGLLFIAAARGILMAEGRQREVYARELRETAYYGDLRRALGIAQRIDREREAHLDITLRVSIAIMDQMLVRDRSVTAAASVEPADDGGRGAVELFKIVADGARGAAKA